VERGAQARGWPVVGGPLPGGAPPQRQ